LNRNETQHKYATNAEFRASTHPTSLILVSICMNLETIRNEALLLPPQERAKLAEQLLSSLDELTEVEIEQLWFQEAVQRAEEMDKGHAQRIPADVVYQEALSLLK